MQFWHIVALVTVNCIMSSCLQATDRGKEKAEDGSEPPKLTRRVPSTLFSSHNPLLFYEARLIPLLNDPESFSRKLEAEVPVHYREEVIESLKEQGYLTERGEGSSSQCIQREAEVESSNISPRINFIEMPQNISSYTSNFVKQEHRIGIEAYEALTLYKKAQKCEADGKIKEAAELYLKSSEIGFIPSLLHLNQIKFLKLIKIIDEKKACLEEKKSKLNTRLGTGRSLQSLIALEMQLLDLNIQVADIQEDFNRLSRLMSENIWFSKRITSSYKNDPEVLLNPDLNGSDYNLKQLISNWLKDEKKAEFLRVQLLRLTDEKVTTLQESSSTLKQIKKELKTKEAHDFVTEINYIIEMSITKLRKLKIIFENNRSENEDLLLNEISEHRLLIENDKRLVSNILKIIKRYAAKEYVLSPIMLEDIRQVKDTVLRILISHKYAFADGNRLLFNFSSNLIASHDSIDIPNALERLKAQLIILREAERYLQAVESPQKYIQLTNPREYGRIKHNSQQLSKKALFQQCYDNDPSSLDFGSSISVKVFLNNFKDRATLYTLWLINRSYESFKEVSLREEAPIALLNLRKQSLRLGASDVRVAEVSPWVPSLNYFLNLAEGQPYEFVFDVGSLSIYIGTCPYGAADGHSYIRGAVGVNYPCGGSIMRIGDARFRTNEASGHYGGYWTDKRRFRFLQVLSAIGERYKEFLVIHEPWISDERRAKDYPSLIPKISSFQLKMQDEAPKRDISFQKMSHEELLEYQTDFIAKCGTINSEVKGAPSS